MTGIRLAMIVRDESAVIERAIASALPFVSSWLIIDTGSTDDTVDRIERALADLPGQVLHRPWVDFAANRSELVSLAADGADWLLLLDADMVVEVDADLDDRLAEHDADAALVAVVGSIRYRMPYLVRGGRPWHFVGRTHEHLSSEQPYRTAPFDALRIVHHGDGGARADKFERDLALLTAAVADDPNDPRSLYYLAQTHRDRGDDLAALEAYRRRAALGGWAEEEFSARLQAALIEERLAPDAVIESLLAAWDSRPTRAEPLYHLARIHRLRRRHRAAWAFASLAAGIPPSDDILFVEDWVWRWGIGFERADAAWRIGERGLAAQFVAAVIDEPGLPADHREHLELIAADLHDSDTDRPHP